MTPKKERITVRLSEELNKVLTEKTKTIGLSKNAYIISLIIRELNFDSSERKEQAV